MQTNGTGPSNPMTAFFQANNNLRNLTLRSDNAAGLPKEHSRSHATTSAAANLGRATVQQMGASQGRWESQPTRSNGSASALPSIPNRNSASAALQDAVDPRAPQRPGRRPSIE